jgi:hypothetical protein
VVDYWRSRVALSCCRYNQGCSPYTTSGAAAVCSAGQSVPHLAAAAADRTLQDPVSGSCLLAVQAIWADGGNRATAISPSTGRSQVTSFSTCRARQPRRPRQPHPLDDAIKQKAGVAGENRTRLVYAIAASRSPAGMQNTTAAVQQSCGRSATRAMIRKIWCRLLDEVVRGVGRPLQLGYG